MPSYLWDTTLGWYYYFGASAFAAEPSPPNIVILLSDDMGYSDVGCYGGEIATPHLDALAAKGFRFTQFYNTARCCPTRASLLTGLHPHQTGVGHMMEDRGYDGYRGNLNLDCVTIAEVLRLAGYRTYGTGKWHITPGQNAKSLGKTNNWPLQRGFDRFYGTIHGAGSYFDPSALVRDNRLVTVANDSEYKIRDYYYTDAIADHAVRFIREHSQKSKAQPFFLYTAFTAAHWPLHGKKSDIAKYRGRYASGFGAIRGNRLEKMRQMGLLDAPWPVGGFKEDWDKVRDKAFEAACMEVYAAQVDSLDQNIGKIITELKAQGLFDNTLIFYLQDNGACAELIGRGNNPAPRPDGPTLPPMDRDAQQFDSAPKQTRDGWPVRQGYGVAPGEADTYLSCGRGWAQVSNTPFREYKHWTHEGGISTPLIVSWPRGLPGSRASSGKLGPLVREPGQLVDIMATCLEAAGAKYPEEFMGRKIKPLAGRSLLPVLRGETTKASPRQLFWEHEGNRAVREGRWKLVAKEDQPWELYDMESDRTETRDMALSQPQLVKRLAGAWDEWAARSDVLPLGAWKRTAAGEAKLNSERRFALQAGQHLARTEAPAIANRAFVLRASVETGPETAGVILAQGGSAHGYALYLIGGQLSFTVRSGFGTAKVSVPRPPPGRHTMIAKFDGRSRLTLQLDDHPEAATVSRGSITSMPADGLDVGSDSGGSVGEYVGPNPFTGKIESVMVELGESPRP